MKQDILSPQWVYSKDDNALSDIATAQLLLWSRGVCVSGHAADGDTLIAKAYAFEPGMAQEVMNAVFLNEPLLAGPQPIQKIWWAGERTLLVPAPFYQEEMADQWIRKVHFIEADESLVHHPVPEPDAVAVFPIRQNLETALAQFFPEANVRMFINKNVDCSTGRLPFKVHVILLGKVAMLTLEEKGKVKEQQVLHYDAVDDIAYKVALALETYHYTPQHTEVVLSGVLADLPAFAAELKAAFPHTELCEETESLKFLTRLSLCE